MNKNGNAARWVIGTLVGVLMFVSGVAARPYLMGKGLEGRVETVEEKVNSTPQYVTLQQQLEYSLEHNSIHTRQAEKLAVIDTKLDMLLREHGIGSIQ